MLRDAHILALEALSWMDYAQIGQTTALLRASRQLGLKDPRTMRTAHLMAMETLRRLNLIDRLIDKALEPQDASRLQLGVRNLLRTFTYWVKFHGAGLQEGLTLLKAGRNALGWRDVQPVEEAFGKLLSIEVPEVLQGLDEIERISLETCHPSWFVKLCFRMLGRSRALSLLRHNLSRAPTYLRINTLAGKEAVLVVALRREGIALEEVEGLPGLYVVKRTAKPLVATEAYAKGYFALQDKSTVLVALAASPKAGQTVLDICAAPGSKTGAMAALMRNRGRIYSIDLSKRRMKVWSNEMRRLGVTVAQPLLADAASALPLNVKADVVLVDPPCSNSGVFWRMPEAKWRMSPRKLGRLLRIQRNVLETGASYVKEGGTLVYSACSVLPNEGEFVIEEFLRVHPEFRLMSPQHDIGSSGLRALSQCRRLYPDLHNCNGYIIAKMVKSIQ